MSDPSSPFGKRPTTLAPLVLQEIASKRESIDAAPTADAGPHWGEMHKLLLKAKVDSQVIMRLVAGRDVRGLALLVRWLHRGEVASDAVAPDVVPVAVEAETMKSAMNMWGFRLSSG